MEPLRKPRKPVSYPRLIALELDKLPPDELLDRVLDAADRNTDECIKNLRKTGAVREQVVRRAAHDRR